MKSESIDQDGDGLRRQLSQNVLTGLLALQVCRVVPGSRIADIDELDRVGCVCLWRGMG